MAISTITIHAKLSILPAGLSYVSKVGDNKPLITLLLEGKTQEEQTKLLKNKFMPQTLFPLDLFIKRKEGDQVVLNFHERNVQIIATCQQSRGKFELERDKAIENSLNLGIRISNNQAQTFEDQMFVTMMKTSQFLEVKLEDINIVKASPKTLDTVDVKLIQKQEYNFDWVEYTIMSEKSNNKELKTDSNFSKGTEKMFKGMFDKKP